MKLPPENKEAKKKRNWSIISNGLHEAIIDFLIVSTIIIVSTFILMIIY